MDDFLLLFISANFLSSSAIGLNDLLVEKDSSRCDSACLSFIDRYYDYIKVILLGKNWMKIFDLGHAKKIYIYALNRDRTHDIVANRQF